MNSINNDYVNYNPSGRIEMILCLESGVGFPANRLDYYKWHGKIRREYFINVENSRKNEFYCELYTITSLNLQCDIYRLGSDAPIPYIVHKVQIGENSELLNDSELFASLSESSQERALELMQKVFKHQARIIVASDRVATIEKELGDAAVMGDGSIMIKEAKQYLAKTQRRFNKAMASLQKLAEDKSDVVSEGDIPTLRQSEYWTPGCSEEFSNMIDPFEYRGELPIEDAPPEDGIDEDIEAFTDEVNEKEEIV